MSLRAHLIELQKRLKFSLLWWGIGFGISLYFREMLIEIIRRPHDWTMAQLKLPSTVYFFSYPDSFTLQLKVCFVAGLILAFPLILYEILKFISPGLKAAEKKRFLYIYLPSFLFLFLSGGLFSYFFLVPYGLYFLILFGTQAGLFPMIGFSDYVSFLLILILMCAFMFELPLVMILVSKMGLFSPKDFRKKRRWAILITFIVAAILTPPDPITQILMAIPMLILYEIGIWGAAILAKK